MSFGGRILLFGFVYIYLLYDILFFNPFLQKINIHEFKVLKYAWFDISTKYNIRCLMFVFSSIFLDYFCMYTITKLDNFSYWHFNLRLNYKLTWQFLLYYLLLIASWLESHKLWPRSSFTRFFSIYYSHCDHQKKNGAIARYENNFTTFSLKFNSHHHHRHTQGFKWPFFNSKRLSHEIILIFY